MAPSITFWATRPYQNGTFGRSAELATKSSTGKSDEIGATNAALNGNFLRDEMLAHALRYPVPNSSVLAA